MAETVVMLSLEDAHRLAQHCCLARGASEDVALSMATATVSAQAHGMHSVGFAHLLDYLDGFACGRIAKDVEPVLAEPAPTIIHCDARKGIAQLGFDRAFKTLCAHTKTLGMCLFSQSNAFTSGELGYYTRRLAAEGLVALAFTNGPALLTIKGQRQPIYSTNPLAFAAASATGRMLMIDQASSATAFVNLVQAAQAGQDIPADWALDAAGQPTLSAKEALQGTLLAFGGTRGANIALMVEVLAAGLTGANWSLDAGDFQSGSESPGAGLLVIAIAPRLLDVEFEDRLDLQMNRLEAMGVYWPGSVKEQAYRRSKRDGVVIPADLHAQLMKCLSGIS